MASLRRALPAALAAALVALGPAAAVEKPKPVHKPRVASKPAETPAPADSQATASLVAQLEALRQKGIGLGREMRQREHTIATLDLAIGVMVQGVDQNTQALDESRQQQEALLAALERLARAPPETLALSPQGPIDRARSAILLAAAVPALAAQARDLTGQLGAMEAVRTRIDASRRDVDGAVAALTQDRATLVQLVARRGELNGQLLRDDGKAETANQAGEQASDLFDLIKRADADNERRDKELAVRLHGGIAPPGKTPPAAVDPTRPKTLRAFDAPRAMMELPVEGEIVHRFGEADQYGRPSQGLAISALPGAVVTAPFDGRIDYAAHFRDGGLILIIRHGAGYHSLMAGLGRADVRPGQWVLAGEPVGILPEADDRGSHTTLQFELRREGRPVDPQSRLASRDEKTGDSKVRQ